MKGFIIFLLVLSPLLVASKLIERIRLTELANSNKIALCEIIVVADSTYLIKVLDNIKGTKKNEVFEIRKVKPAYSTQPISRFADYSVGQKEIIFFDFSGFELLGKFGESELLYRNDSVFTQPNEFCHGCFNEKYIKPSPLINGIKMMGFPYIDFKTAIQAIGKRNNKYIGLLLSEPEIKNEKKRWDGAYNAKTGVVPNLENKNLLKFRSTSSFHEYILDLLIDKVLTTSI